MPNAMKGLLQRRPEVGSLMDRLVLGGAPDSELYVRGEACRQLFEAEPLQRALWLPQLRAAADMAIAGNLWPEVKPVLSGRREAGSERCRSHPRSAMSVDAWSLWSGRSGAGF